MQLSYSEIVRILMDMHDIARDSEGAFRARLRHFQRLGFPPGTNTGRGRPAPYRAEHVFLMTVVLELTEFGFSPDRATRYTFNSVEHLAEGVFMFLDGENDESVWCSLAANALADLTPGADEKEYMHCFAFHRLLVSLSMGQKNLRRIALFSVSGLIEQIANLLPGEDRVAEFRSDLREWSKEACFADQKADFFARLKEARSYIDVSEEEQNGGL